jgi:hypothetical protein
MPSNDLLLLDSILQKNKLTLGSRSDESEYFELFVIDNVLKNYDLSLDELEDGWVDGGDDGGVDGFYVFIDGMFLSDDLDLKFVRSEPNIEIFIFSVKLAEGFKQAPLTALVSTVPDLLTLVSDQPTNPYLEKLLHLRNRFKVAYSDLADKKPSVKINILYCSRGDVSRVNKNVRSKANQLRSILERLFSRSSIEIRFIGATELLLLAQRQKAYSLRLPYTETYISRDGTNYVLLCPLNDYLRFITDDEGQLRRYLFEGNVRDYLGDVQINSNIANTLRERGNVDFWWLNNGITILASGATVIGKSLSLENVLIVNGLQTTETIYRVLRDDTHLDDTRAVLIKIIISTDDDVRARIIKATNYQNAVALLSLRSLDQIQKNIEQYLLDHGWFYERRTNMYRNQGKPGDRIISIDQLGVAVRALAFKAPRTAETRKKWLRDDNSYKEVFNEAWPLDLFLACANISRSVEILLRTKNSEWPTAVVFQRTARRWANMIALLITCVRLKSAHYEPPRLAELANVQITIEEVIEAAGHLAATLQKFRAKYWRSITHPEELDALDALAAAGFQFSRPDPSGIVPLTRDELRLRKEVFWRSNPKPDDVDPSDDDAS